MKTLVLGSGSLVRSLCYGLSALAGPQMQLHVAARSADDVNEIVAASRIRARLFGSSTSFTGSTIQWEEDALEREIARMQPAFVVHVASMVSPWERQRPESRWAQLLRRSGFGLTLPLQSVFALKIARAVERSAVKCQLINASYPDGVNPVLAAAGHRILCGVGNIAILAAAYSALRPELPFTMLAHHSDLACISHADDPGGNRVRIWRGGLEIQAQDPEFLRSIRRIRGPEMNQVTGATIASLLNRLAVGDDFRCHLPGPNGLPGGYPVRFSKGEVSLDLPSGVTKGEAIAHNQESARKEGVFVTEAGSIQFSESTSEALSELAPEIPASFAAGDVERVADLFVRLRNRGESA